MFQVQGVSRTYGGERALRDVTFELGGGMNYIVGPSGSGKSTLLRIMSGMDGGFEGEVSYNGEDIRSLARRERGRLFGQVFGFAWQDFNLLEDRTVVENIALPSHLSPDADGRAIAKTMKEMKVAALANRRVRELSGGQKQRVAIARELVKDPEVIFADEPTSALDKRSAKATMDILRVLARTRTVIVVTHDRSLLSGRATVCELDKGTLVSHPEPKRAAPAARRERRVRLSPVGALRLGSIAARRNPGHALAIVLAVLVSASLLLTSVGNGVAGSGQSAFDRLYASYGDQLLDVNLFSSLIGAGQGGGKRGDDPDVNVNQDVSGLYDTYAHDDRVSLIMLPQAFQDIRITVDSKSYDIASTYNVPVMSKLLAGSMPTGDGDEIAVPDSFVSKLGISNADAIGIELDFSGSVYNWSSGSATATPVSAHAKITGVFSADLISDVSGKTVKTPIGDSFFFSAGALAKIRESAGLDGKAGGLYLRAKTPADMISLKNELNAKGIVPTGHFELVENLVKMNEQTNQQSGSVTLVIGALSVVVVAAVALIGACLRRREFAILQVSGFVGRRLAAVCVGEFVWLAAASGAAFLVASPLTSMASAALWKVSFLRPDLIAAGVVMAVALCLLACLITLAVALLTRASAAMQRGDR